jgi:dopamine beta-monooxygenase
MLYTPNLRKYDAGILETGVIYSDAMALPPGENGFDVHGYCMPQCTAQVSFKMSLLNNG